MGLGFSVVMVFGGFKDACDAACASCAPMAFSAPCDASAIEVRSRPDSAKTRLGFRGLGFKYGF